MRVLHVEGGRNLYGGAHQILLLAEGLQQRGVDNVIACRLGSELSRAALPVAEVHAIRMGGDLDFGLLGRLFRLIQRTRPDIVHLHSRIGADVMGGIASRLAGVPVVHSRRQDNPEARLVVALKYRLHDRVIAISDGIAEVLLSEGLSAQKLRVVRDAVDATPFLHAADRAWFAREFGLDSDGPFIGVVAQLIPRKGHRYLLEAIPPLLASFPGLKVLFFGKGPMETELRQRIDLQGLRQHVHLVGFRDDLPRILPCLDLFVHPALKEGLGVSLLQASSAGLPIVASRAGGIPEAVRDGVSGILVDPAHSVMLGQAINTLLSDSDLRLCMGAAGRELVQREFSANHMVEGNLAVYRELVG